MNLALLEKMVGEGDLSRDAFLYLLACRGECEWLDYKKSLTIDQDHELCSFAKDALAMKNVGGGYILVGVEDKTWEQVGILASFPYDTKMLRDKLVRATGVSLEVDVVQHYMEASDGRKLFALVLVRASRKRGKRRSPTLAAKDFCAGKPFGLRCGDIFVRDGDSTTKVSIRSNSPSFLSDSKLKPTKQHSRNDLALRRLPSRTEHIAYLTVALAVSSAGCSYASNS